MIKVYGLKRELNPIKKQMSDVLHKCMQQVLGLPEDKRAHRFFPMEKEDFFCPKGRSDAYTVIEINMISGRSTETQKRLIKAVFDAFEAELDIADMDVEVTITEQPAHCWGFRGITGDEAVLGYKIEV